MGALRLDLCDPVMTAVQSEFCPPLRVKKSAAALQGKVRGFGFRNYCRSAIVTRTFASPYKCIKQPGYALHT